MTLPLLQRYIQAVQRPGPTYFSVGTFTEAELWELVSLGLYEARAEGRCEDDHVVWSQTVAGPIEPVGMCDVCWSDGWAEEPPVTDVTYEFWPKLIPRKTETAPTLSGIQWKAEVLLQAYPPDLFPPLSEEAYMGVPAEVRRALWIRAVQDVTQRILAIGKS